MSDRTLAEELRYLCGITGSGRVCHRAADRIEALEQRVKVLEDFVGYVRERLDHAVSISAAADIADRLAELDALNPSA